MALSDDDIIQSNTGSVAASSSITVSLSSGTTAGNTVLMFCRLNASATIPTLPAGWTLGASGFGYYKSNVGAGETSWAFTPSAATDCAWIAVEMSNLDLVEPFELLAPTGAGTNVSLGTAATLATTTSGSCIGLSTVAFGVFGCYVSSGTATKSWGTFTNGFTQVAQIDSTLGTNRPCVAVTRLFTTGAPATFQVTGTQTISTGTSVAQNRVLVFREAGSPISAPLANFTGFEFGTHGGLAENTVHATGSNSPIGGLNVPPVGTWGTHYQIGASFARSSDYGMRISTSAATCNVPMLSVVQSSGPLAFNVRPVSGTGTPTLMTLDVSTGTDLLLVWDATTEQLGLRWGAGTVSWQTGTTPANTWAWVEIRCKVNDTTHKSGWWCETGTGDGSQTAPADLTGMTSTTYAIKASSLSSQTVTFDLDDPIYSNYYAAFPLGSHRVVRLGVDTGGTATVSGTAANFNVFTANGTLAAFNSANALAALDECPPTVSASADGIVQVTTASTEYVELPMQDLTLASDEVIGGVRMIACMWGGTGTGTGDLMIKAFDGASTQTLVNRTAFDPGSPTAYSATEPLWMAAGWGNTAGSPWTLTRLNAAVLRVGYSTDATPDMGISAIYLEVAIRKTPVVRQITQGEADEFTVDIRLQPFNSASVSYLLGSTHATCGATFNYSVSGTPQTPVYVAASSTQEVVVTAAAFGDISIDSFEPDPLP